MQLSGILMYLQPCTLRLFCRFLWCIKSSLHTLQSYSNHGSRKQTL